MLGPVQPTNFDLDFSLLGIPVRVSAWFWLGGTILGFSALKLGPQYLLAWLLVLFISILVHELGHALLARVYGYPPRILLYHFGGLAFFEPRSRFTKAKSISISLAGPVAGFVLYGLTILFELTAYRGLVPQLSQENAFLLTFVLIQMKYINLFWGLINLLPVLPLDGGQICRDICLSFTPRSGVQVSLKIGIFISGAVAVYFFMNEIRYPALLFAMLCASNISSLQQGQSY